ncbi:hypothetical protein Cgig2_018784 [Carnegiea gigantea]|uniref:Uncharacterized protein n=1 Tax=Carnegiea gigantea TaxID=171969 RepID=A0A9Q1K7G9_9CARY|nr:hypothetical protein Cgig2_018784 [Carnegiea gigantea]
MLLITLLGFLISPQLAMARICIPMFVYIRAFDEQNIHHFFKRWLRTRNYGYAQVRVRVGQILEGGSIDTRRLGKHRGAVYKLALEPASPYIFYSCGEDGYVQHFDLRSNSSTKLFCCSSFTEDDKPSSSSTIRLNAIVIDPRNPNYLSVAGSDEYVRVHDLRKCHWDASRNLDKPVDTFCPPHLRESGNVHITGLAYSSTSELLASYNDELIYLFQKNMGMGPNPLTMSPEELQKLEEPQVYSGHRNSQTIKGVNFFGPNDEYVVSGSDCGHIFIWKKKDAKLVRLMVGDRHIVNQLEQHPSIPVLATCGIEKTAKIWAPSSNDVQPLPPSVCEIMESNRQGREDHSRVTLTPDVIMHVLRLQRRQTLAFVERQPNEDGDGSDDDNRQGQAFILRFADGENGSDGGNPRECNIS